MIWFKELVLTGNSYYIEISRNSAFLWFLCFEKGPIWISSKNGNLVLKNKNVCFYEKLYKINWI